MSDPSARQLVEAIYRSVNDRAFDALDDLFSADYVDHADGAHGVEPLKLRLRAFVAAFPDLRVEVEDVVSEGERFASRTTTTGTHGGDLMGVPATGRRISVSAVDLGTTRGGRVAQRWGGLDMYGLLVQLGVIPEPQSA